MYTWEAIMSHVARRLSEATNVPVHPTDLVTPPKPELGDVAYGCFAAAKAQGKNPAEIAKAVAEELSKGDLTIEKAVATGPYVNVSIKSGELIARIIRDVEQRPESFGEGEIGARKQLLFEYAQPNTHKEVHVGHLRNLALGVSVHRLLANAGWDVVPMSYHGDVGAHVSKCLWLFVRGHADLVPQPVPKKKSGAGPAMSPEEWTEYVLKEFNNDMASQMLEAFPKEQRNGKYLGRLYAEATKLLDENPEWKEQVSDVQRKLEASAPGWNRIWQETKHWSVDEMSQIFQEFGVSIDRQYFESEVVDDGQRIVDQLIAQGVARESQGAIVVDLEADKLGVFLVRKSDGTSLYATKDLALAFLKAREYPKAARSLIMVDNRQALYFKQLFKTLELMGFKTPLEFIGYEFVTLKSGAMSSREGNVVTLESFRDDVLEFARRETRQRHEDWPEGKIEHTAWCLALGGIKFGMLKQDSDKIFTFELERALSFDGDTGPYVQYSAVRLQSILKKGDWSLAKGASAADPTLLSEPMEKRLALQIAHFPAACARAAEELRPAVVAQWCVSMAQLCNEFYRDVTVLDAPFATKQARLQLVAAAHNVLVRGLDLLGIPVPDEM